MTAIELWKKFLLLPWWKQVLLAVPFALVMVVPFLLYGSGLWKPLPQLPVDGSAYAKVKQSKKQIKAIAKEAAKVAGEIAALKNDDQEAQRELEETMARIDAAGSPDDLVAIAAELRRRRDDIAAGGNPS